MESQYAWQSEWNMIDDPMHAIASYLPTWETSVHPLAELCLLYNWRSAGGYLVMRMSAWVRDSSQTALAATVDPVALHQHMRSDATIIHRMALDAETLDAPVASPVAPAVPLLVDAPVASPVAPAVPLLVASHVASPVAQEETPSDEYAESDLVRRIKRARMEAVSAASDEEAK